MKTRWVILTLLFVLLMSVLNGCGGDSNNQTSMPPPEEQTFLTAGETSLPSSKIAKLAHSLNGSASNAAIPKKTDKVVNSVWLDALVLGDIIKGVVYDVIDGTKPDEYKEISDELASISATVNKLDSDLKDLKIEVFSRLNDNLLKTIDSDMQTTAYIPITKAFSAKSDPSLTYFSDSRTYNAKTYLNDKDKLKAAQDTLASKVDPFIKDNRSSVDSAISIISSKISGTGSPQVLKLYTNGLILGFTSDAKTDQDKVIKAYLSLEKYFTSLLYYQFQGAAVIVNIKNYEGKTGLDTAGYYLNSTFAPMIKDEMTEFLKNVDYLIANLHDYRNKDSYGEDMKNELNGLAPENDFNFKVLARSRFFCAQIMQAYNKEPGLAGSIVLPNDYTDGNDMVLELRGPVINDHWTNVPPTYPMYAKYTIKKSALPVRYPYTKWAGAKAYPAYDWLSYDFNFALRDIPSGDYQLYRADHGKSGTWVTVDNQPIGTVSVKYYNPEYGSAKPDTTTSTYTPDSTHTLKFGYFAYKWPWNFQRISGSPFSEWIVSDHFRSYDGQSKKDNPLLPKGGSVYPKKGKTSNDTIINEIWIYTGENTTDVHHHYDMEIPVQLGDGLNDQSVRILQSTPPSTIYNQATYASANGSDWSSVSYMFRIGKAADKLNRDTSAGNNYNGLDKDGVPYFQRITDFNEQFNLNNYGFWRKTSTDSLDYKMTKSTQYIVNFEVDIARATQLPRTNSGNLDVSWCMQLLFLDVNNNVIK